MITKFIKIMAIFTVLYFIATIIILGLRPIMSLALYPPLALAYAIYCYTVYKTIYGD